VLACALPDLLLFQTRPIAKEIRPTYRTRIEPFEQIPHPAALVQNIVQRLRFVYRNRVGQ
jgi:hypothetical protein